MPEQADIKAIRTWIGPVEHHTNCVSHKGKRCDCYAGPRVKVHAYLDRIAAALRAARNEGLEMAAKAAERTFDSRWRPSEFEQPSATIAANIRALKT